MNVGSYTKISTIATVLSVMIGILAWWFPVDDKPRANGKPDSPRMPNPTVDNRRDKSQSTVIPAPPPVALSDASIARALTEILRRSACRDSAVEFSGLIKSHIKANESLHGMEATFLQITLEAIEAPKIIVQSTGRGKGSREVAVAQLAENVAIVIKERSLCE